MRFILNLHQFEASAGVRANWYLLDLIGKLGYSTASNVPADPDDIVIYPDCIRGNPLNARRIVRYFMFFPSTIGDHWHCADRTPASELMIVWHQSFFEDSQKLYDGKLGHPITIPTIESGLFYPEAKGIESMVYTGKYTFHELPEIPIGVIVTRTSHSRKDLANMMRRTHNFYSMDHWTAALYEAALCECATFLVHGRNNFSSWKQDMDPQSLVMNESKDLKLAREFVERALDFFK